MAILILAPRSDVHVQAVAAHLQRFNVAVDYYSLPALLKRFTFHLRLGLAGPESRLRTIDVTADQQASMDLFTYSAVWLRRPGKVKSIEMPEPWASRLVETESNRAVEGFFRVIPTLWINDPAAHSEALYKVRQLEIARQCGLNIPDTLITNDPVAVKEFYSACDGEVIYKLVDESSGLHLPAYEVPRGIPTLPLRPEDLVNIEQVRYSLHLFQRCIDKSFDLRLTIVGRKIFSVEIHSQQGKGKFDFRLDYSVPMKVHHLPEPIAQSCLELMRRLGLNFGAVDLCVDKQGNYHFFEINPAGQWLWMESELELPISLELASVLAGLESPLIPQ